MHSKELVACCCSWYSVIVVARTYSHFGWLFCWCALGCPKYSEKSAVPRCEFFNFRFEYGKGCLWKYVYKRQSWPETSGFIDNVKKVPSHHYRIGILGFHQFRGTWKLKPDLFVYSIFDIPVWENTTVPVIYSCFLLIVLLIIHACWELHTV